MKVTKKKSRLYKNVLFSTVWLCHATLAALTQMPALAFVSLTEPITTSLPLKTYEIFIMSVLP